MFGTIPFNHRTKMFVNHSLNKLLSFLLSLNIKPDVDQTLWKSCKPLNFQSDTCIGALILYQAAFPLKGSIKQHLEYLNLYVNFSCSSGHVTLEKCSFISIHLMKYIRIPHYMFLFEMNLLTNFKLYNTVAVGRCGGVDDRNI